MENVRGLTDEQNPSSVPPFNWCELIRPLQSKRLPVVRELGETSLMFLVHPTLTSDEMALTCKTLNQVLNATHR